MVRDRIKKNISYVALGVSLTALAVAGYLNFNLHQQNQRLKRDLAKFTLYGRRIEHNCFDAYEDGNNTKCDKALIKLSVLSRRVNEEYFK